MYIKLVLLLPLVSTKGTETETNLGVWGNILDDVKCKIGAGYKCKEFGITSIALENQTFSRIYVLRLNLWRSKVSGSRCEDFEQWAHSFNEELARSSKFPR